MTSKFRARIAFIAGVMVITPWLLAWFAQERNHASFEYFIGGLPDIAMILLYASPFLAIVLFWMGFRLNTGAVTGSRASELSVEIISAVVAVLLFLILLQAKC